ncbi:hypothetical protein L5B97_04100 [Avibacterium sp. 20-15]|nr:hypothetical protein [Avibacterium sp. 20-15]URL04828.1 hypothetical protein L4F93_02795 [Avibacterium sp. 20-132]
MFKKLFFLFIGLFFIPTLFAKSFTIGVSMYSLSDTPLIKVTKGEKVPAIKWIPFELVTPDKKTQYLNKYKE